MARRDAQPPDVVAGWDALADAYQHEVGWPDDELTWGLRCPPESELRLVCDVAAGATTVVLGCGGGQDLLALARLGAGPLTGVDPSRRQLDHARRRLASAGVDATLLACSATRLDPVPDGTADLVVSVQALNYVEDLHACFAEVHRVLRPGAVFAMSVLHPADVSTDDEPPHGWHRSYHDAERDWVWDGLAEDDIALRSWFPTPAAWFTAAKDAGLIVERLLEPAPVEDERWIERGWLNQTTAAKLDLVPGTILLRATRPR